MAPVSALLVLACGALVGALLVLYWARPRLDRALRDEARARRELADARPRLEGLEAASRRVVELASHGIEEPARDAHRVMRGRSEAQGALGRAIDELERTLGLGAGIAGGMAAAVVEFEGSARRTGQVLEEQGQRMRLIAIESDQLSQVAETAGTAAGALTESIAELERGVDGLTNASVDTADASAQMEDSLRRVQIGTGDTADIAAKVANEAERGYRAVHRTLDEIERVRSLAETARLRIDALGGRVIGIGDVVRVIQEIGEKTNLLALNASIIAAQAGEHGRSFGVVAQEIKALAHRTATSTKQIREQIAGVREESERAADAVATGVEAIAQGFQVALHAGDALGEIRQGTRSAQKKVQAMLRSIDEQASASRRVVDAANVLAERAARLATVIKEQGLHRGRLADTGQTLVDSAQRISRVSREQLESGRTLGDIVGRVMQETSSFSRGQKDIRRSIDRIHDGAARLSGLEGEVVDRIEAVNQAAAQLCEELARMAAS
jgi:methyl-accepting chemotaxis protein